ncbi:MAG: ATP-binding cassette domain-containing protein [Magnetococcales bacterium]|nr:ATP-binding cassette domain-containing protein [Magnetococcales bacterium]
MKQETLVEVEGLWKQYGFPITPYIHRLKHRVGSLLTRQPYVRPELPWAIQDLSFSVRRGETLGIIGRNGSGKSTLLKTLAGVTPPRRGVVKLKGRIFPMIELHAGIHVELTGAENIRLLGALNGLTQQELKEKLPKIIDFCELGPWLDRPVRMYSSGMVVRLGFAVGAFVDADILLIDEVMAVGDTAFYNKCLRHLEYLRSLGTCMLFVSHNMNKMKRVCDRILLMDYGVPLFLGEPDVAVAKYEKLIRPKEGSEALSALVMDDLGVELDNLTLTSADGNRIDILNPGDDLILTFDLNLSEMIEDATLNVSMENMEAIPIIWESLPLEKIKAGLNRFRLHLHQLRVQNGLYFLRISIDVGQYARTGFQVTRAAQIQAQGVPHSIGLYKPERDFSCIEHP